jgi:hypothetical protein
MQAPIVDSGSDAPAYGGQPPAYSGTSTFANNGGYDASYSTTGTPGTAYNGNHGATGGGDPFASGASPAGSVAQGSASGQGYYDPNTYGGSTEQASTPTNVYGGDRYAASDGGYGQTINTGVAASAGGATPWPPQDTASPQNVASAGYNYNATSSTPSENGSTYGSTYGSNYGGAAGTAYQAGGQATGLAASMASSSMPPYRPGGTSDYVTTGATSAVSVASRQGAESGVPAAGDATASGAPTYRYGTQPSYEPPVTGRRY